MRRVPIEVRAARSFADVRTVVGPERPDADVCWCLSYRLSGAENRALRKQARGEKVRALVRRTLAPGVLAYDVADDGEEVAGWAGIHPRADTTFATTRRIPHLDDPDEVDVWSSWCVRVRPGHREQGIAHHLVRGAVDLAREHDAAVVEAYPVDNRGGRVDLTMAYVGTKALFASAGFTQAAETTSRLDGFPRVLMRLDLR